MRRHGRGVGMSTAEKPDLKPGRHTLSVEIFGERVALTLNCLDTDVVCRMKCTEECGAETYPCTGADERYHDLVDAGYCNAVLSMEDPAEACDEDEIKIYDGMPVRVFWDGDNWLWVRVSA